jgi:hypothetical protein
VIAPRRSWALYGGAMNTLSKVLAVFCALLSAVVFAKWERTGTTTSPDPTLAGGQGGVALATSSDGKTIYYSCAYRLYKSTDGGETWTVLR